MNHFQYQKNELFCEKSAIKDIAHQVGTPLYIYSYRTLMENFQAVEKAFASFNPLICYSLKANSNLTLCNILSSLGAGADVVSGGELYTALRAGFTPEKIVYAGVGKTLEEIEYALKKKILLFNVESEEELEEIAGVAEKLREKAPISLRINPDIDPETHHYITTGKKENKFGVSFDEAEKLYQKIRQTETLKAMGIHVHIGSQITNIEPYLKTLKKLKNFLGELQKNGIKLTYLDMGGGFGINYRKREKKLSVEKLAQQISPLFPKDMRLILEPGRYIVGNSGVLVTRLTYRKKGAIKRFFIVDAGMNDLIRPSLYGAYHQIIPVKKPSQQSLLKVNVVGPVCESGDFFLQDAELPFIEKGGLLAILDAGAYGFSMSSNYNGRTRPSEVLVKKDKWWVIRERENYQDLIRGQKISLKNSYSPKDASSLSYPNIQFWKMEGTGNDFILIDNRKGIVKEKVQFARNFCQRKTGIGADGLILIEKAKEADFTMHIFNSDGSEAEMCGNGARCAVLFAYLKGIIGKECHFQTLSGKIAAKIKGTKIKIKMGNPSDLREVTELNIDGKTFKGYHINTGVPHFILFSSNLDKISAKELGAKIRFHKFFHPQGTNVDFTKVEKDKVSIRTYERGVEDETLSCGTGAVASALISALVNKLTSPIRVLTKGGEVTVWFQLKETKFNNVFLEGEANIVYKGGI